MKGEYEKNNDDVFGIDNYFLNQKRFCPTRVSFDFRKTRWNIYDQAG